MEIISNCAQKVPRFDAAKRLVPCTSHGALVEPATNKLCIEENNFGTEDRRFGSNAFPHTDQAPGTSWNAFLDPISASQIFSSGVKIVASTWDSQNVLHISEEDPTAVPSDRAGAPSVRVPRADALKVALLGPFDVLNGHASDPRLAGRGETHLQGVEGSESPCRARPGGHSTFGWVKESPDGSPVRACMHADLQAVLPIYWKSVASGVTQK